MGSIFLKILRTAWRSTKRLLFIIVLVLRINKYWRKFRVLSTIASQYFFLLGFCCDQIKSSEAATLGFRSSPCGCYYRKNYSSSGNTDHGIPKIQNLYFRVIIILQIRFQVPIPYSHLSLKRQLKINNSIREST